MKKPVSEDRPRRWYAVPKHRIIDAAPVAGIAILLSIPYCAAIAMVLLQMWLWLRHPRSKSRYFIALFVALLPILPSFGMWLFVAYLDAKYGGDELRHFEFWSVLPALVGCLAAAGIVPILYRLISRNSLTFTDPAREQEDNETQETRGSIADILFLSIFCAIVFVVVQATTYDDFFGWFSPADLIALVLGGSIAAILAMLIMKTASGPAWVIRLFVSFVIGMLLISACMELGRYLQWLAEENSRDFKFMWESSYGYRSTTRLVTASALPLPIFAIVMRGCGVVLGRPNPKTEKATQKKGLASKAIGWLSGALGSLVVGLVAALFCFMPVSNRDFSAAGWPLTYVFRVELDEVWQTVSFSWFALLADIVFWLLVTLAMATPAFVAARLSSKAIWRWRLVIMGCFVFCFAYTCYIQPLRHDDLAARIGGGSLSKSDILDSPLAVMWDSLEDELDFLPRIDRRRITSASLLRAEPDLIRQVLAERYLRRLAIQDCDIPADAMESLRGSPYLKELMIRRCSMKPSAAAVIGQFPQLTNLTIDASLAEVIPADKFTYSSLNEFAVVTDQDGRIPVPGGARFMTVFLPDDQERSIQILQGENVEKILLRNTTGDVPPTVSTVLLQNLPALELLDLDNCQKIDLTIREAPMLRRIMDEQQSPMFYQGDVVTGKDGWLGNFGRLTGLRMESVPSLQELEIDISDCKTSNVSMRLLDDTADGPHSFYRLSLNGRRHQSETDDGRLPDDRLADVLSALPETISVEYLEIYGATIGKQTAGAIERCQPADLLLRDCAFTDGAFDEIEGLPRLVDLEAETYAPTDDQLQHFAAACPNLDRLHIDGSKLTRLPASLAPQDGSIRLGNADNLQFIAPETIQNVAILMTHGREQYELADRYPNLSGGPMIWLHGPSANPENLSQIALRLMRGGEPLDIALVNPTAGEEHFQRFDWMTTEALSVINARIDDETVASWKLPNVRQIDVSQCDVSAGVIKGLIKQAPSMYYLRLRNIELGGPLPDLSAPSELTWLNLSGNTITKVDLDRLRKSSLNQVFLMDCQLPQETEEDYSPPEGIGPQIIYGTVEDKTYLETP